MVQHAGEHHRTATFVAEFVHREIDADPARERDRSRHRVAANDRPRVELLDRLDHAPLGWLVAHRQTAEQVAHKGDAKGIHLPAPSYWPLVIALGLPLIGYGIIFNLWLCVPGGIITLAGIFGFALEPADDPDAHPHDDHGHEGEHELAAVTVGGSAGAPAAEETDNG